MIASKISFSSSGTGFVFQNSLYIGISITNILYGIELLLYFKTMRILLTTRKMSKKSNVFFLLFNSTMVILVTVYVATQTLFGEELWTADTRDAGSPEPHWTTTSPTYYLDCGTTAAVLLQLMTDALMIYHCQVIWTGYRVIIVPLFLWLATLVLGILADWTTISPRNVRLYAISPQFSFAYYTVAVVLNTTLTCLICYRILQHGREVQEHIGHEYARLYLTITLIVESVLPYTVSCTAYLVSLAIGSSTSIAFASVYVMMMCVSPQMLILRVIAGKAWENHTSGQPGSSPKFSPESIGATTQPFGVNGARIHVQTLSNVYSADDKV